MLSILSGMLLVTSLPVFLCIQQKSRQNKPTICFDTTKKENPSAIFVTSKEGDGP
jgi:hypothetical protein